MENNDHNNNSGNYRGQGQDGGQKVCIHVKFRYLSILDELRYLPTVYLFDCALHDSIKDSLESIVKSVIQSLAAFVCVHFMGYQKMNC